MAWIRQAQERNDQKYFFNGKAFITNGAKTLLNNEEVINLILELQQLAIKEGGLDYLQVFKNENEKVIWVIDQIDEDMKDKYPLEHNYFTILLPSEY